MPLNKNKLQFKKFEIKKRQNSVIKLELKTSDLCANLSALLAKRLRKRVLKYLLRLLSFPSHLYIKQINSTTLNQTAGDESFDRHVQIYSNTRSSGKITMISSNCVYLRSLPRTENCLIKDTPSTFVHCRLSEFRSTFLQSSARAFLVEPTFDMKAILINR